MNTTRFPALSVLLVTLLLAQAAAAAESDVVKRTFAVGSRGKLVLDADRGSVAVRTGSSDQVLVEVFRTARSGMRGSAEELLEQHKIEMTQTGDEISIKARLEGAQSWGFGSPSLTVRYAIAVPREWDAQLRTAGGSIEVKELDGSLSATTAGGRLDLGRIGGPVTGRSSGGSIHVESGAKTVDVSTSGGSIRIGHCAEQLKASTSGGSIEINDAKGAVEARTSGGSIRLATSGSAVDANTSGGSIQAQLRGRLEKDSKLRTSGGSIEVTLGGDVGVGLDAKTSGGRVATELPVTVTGEQRGSALQGELQGGGPRLELRTSGGGIRIRKG